MLATIIKVLLFISFLLFLEATGSFFQEEGSKENQACEDTRGRVCSRVFARAQRERCESKCSNN